MKTRVGIDAVEIDRIEKSIQNHTFLKKILGEQEYAYYESKGFPPESVAGAFSAKEAFSKAMGSGIRGFDLTEVEIIHDYYGKPYYSFSGKAKKLVQRKRLQFQLSITHTRTTAMAVAVAEPRSHISYLLSNIVKHMWGKQK